MGLLQHATQAFLADMGVDLRRAEIGMSEQLLHLTQIGAAVEQVSGVGVPESVRMRGRCGPAVEQTANVARCDGASPEVYEDGVRFRERLSQRPPGSGSTSPGKIGRAHF